MSRIVISVLAMMFIGIDAFAESDVVAGERGKYSEFRSKLKEKCDEMKSLKIERNQFCQHGTWNYGFLLNDDSEKRIASFQDWLREKDSTCKPRWFYKAKELSCESFIEALDQEDKKCQGCLTYYSVHF